MLFVMRIVLAIVLVACGSKSDAPTAGSGSARGSAAVAPVDASTGPAVAVGADGLPTVCGDWKAAIDKLATCTALPANARESLTATYKDASSGWGQLPADAKKHLVDICRAGADAVLRGAKATCNW